MSFKTRLLCFLMILMTIYGKIRTTKNNGQSLIQFYANERSNSLVLKQFQLEQFSWSSCAGPSASTVIKKIELSDPVSIPGNVTFSVDASLLADVTSPLKAAVQVQKKVGFFWVDVPCVDNIGSCKYDDFCTVIPFPPGKPCPDPLAKAGISCHCPFEKGNFTVENGVLAIPDEHLPEFLARGQYTVRVEASSKGREVVCLKLYFSLA